jgi:hypothetical protein
MMIYIKIYVQLKLKPGGRRITKPSENDATREENKGRIDLVVALPVINENPGFTRHRDRQLPLKPLSRQIRHSPWTLVILPFPLPIPFPFTYSFTYSPFPSLTHIDSPSLTNSTHPFSSLH